MGFIRVLKCLFDQLTPWFNQSNYNIFISIWGIVGSPKREIINQITKSYLFRETLPSVGEGSDT